MEFKQLEAFIAVVEWNSFSMAAKKLYLTQPTVSAHIRTLEKELDTTLLNRTTKQIHITEDGKYLYERAKQMMDLKRQVYDRFQERETHRIRLGASTIPSLYIFPQILPVFHKKYPAIKLELWQSDSKGVLERIRNQQIDMGMIGMKTEDPSFSCIPVAKDELVIAAPYNDYFLEIKKNPSWLKLLLKEPMILREGTSGSGKEAFRFLEQMRIDPSALNVVAQMNDQEMIKASIKSGLGISIMSGYSVMREEKNGELLVFHPDQYESQRKFYIVYEKSQVLPVHMQQLIHTLSDIK